MPEPLQIIIFFHVTIIDPIGDQAFDVELPGDAPMNQLVPQLLSALGVSQQGGFTLLHARTERFLGPNETLLNAGVQSGDALLIASAPQAAGAIPVLSFREIHLIEAAIHQRPLIRSRNQVALFAVILYTDEDAELATYVRQHIRDLHEMSARCMFFVIEEPSPDWQMDVKSYMEDLFGDDGERLWDRLEASSFRPYSRSQAYDIARRFDVVPRQLPCVIFFPDLSSKRSLVVELKQFANTSNSAFSAYTEVFRALFSLVNAATDAPQEKRLNELARLLAAERWKRKIQSSTEGIKLADVGKSLIEVIATLVK